MMKQILFLSLVASLLAFGCKKEDQSEIDRNLILQYLIDNNLTAEEDPSGLFYIIEVAGGEEKPTLSSQVTLTYSGKLLNGNVFDEVPNADRDDITFPLNNLIQGWQIGIPKFGRGGSGKLLIPSALGYGSRATGSIPANSVLIFDIGLIDF